ncbi:MAG TPA: fenitrothion hydrolase [Baekduia sp.]|uniref:fenitrothion hydrolase n=1 Tax=Baekduia sp. TaxID=2600305 RepID=UPI002D7739E7|nr:fenitrothion hydrolase [Baekduia sp.]HET6507658.1 fenitrothion hydrolase [Baekduia sp.]
MTPKRRRALSALCAVGLALSAPATASAHGLVGKQDLPIPRWLFAWAAAVVLVASFVGLAVLWATPRLQEVAERRRLDVPRVLEVLSGTVGVAFFAYCIYAGFAGTQAATANLLPTVIFVFFWVVVPFAGVVFGDVFRAVNPWLAIGKATGWLVKRTGAAGADGAEPLAYPTWLGRWPAAIGILIFAWVELVYADRDDPSQLATMALAYTAVQLIGMSLYGVAQWSTRGDAFGVYFGLFARISPLHWRDRALFTRPLLGGAPRLTPVPGTVALLCIMIGTTSFDGFSQGKTWSSIVPHLQDFFGSLGFNAEHALEWAGTVGIVVMCCFIGLLYRLGVMGMHTVGRRLSTRALSGAFVHTLIPIAFAYVLAHYFSLVAYNGQSILPLLSDPLGNGKDYFGWSDVTINYTWISATGIWYVQVGALVLGHVAGLALAHDRALALFERARDATRSQYWMLAVMVAFTSLGLWLLSAAAQQ